MKVIKKESKVPWMLEMKDDLLTYDTPLGETFDEFSRLSRMDDDLFTYEVRIHRLSCPPYNKPQCDNLENYDHEVYEQKLCYDAKEKIYAEVRKNDVFEHDTDMEYDPSNVEFTKWMALKFGNHSMMYRYTKNALWMYWVRGNDEDVLTHKKLSNRKETYVNEEDETAKIFRIVTDMFDFQTPLFKAFDEFNYLLKAC
nr:SGNH hydrolase-type esterase domain-containing protein [Tanacetum cinerariifolium]